MAKILFVLSLLAALHQVYPNVLQRDIDLNQSPKLEFRDVIDQIRNIDIRGEAVKLVFKNSEGTASDLDDLLATKSNPEVSDVLDIFNRNFGVKLLVVNGENVQVDPDALQSLLSDQAMSLVKIVFPQNVFQQYMVYGVLQQQIQRISQDVRPEIENRKIPIEQMTAVMVSDGHQIVKRSLIGDIGVSLGAGICNSIVKEAYTNLNRTLTSILEFLDTIAVGGDSNVTVTIISGAVKFASSALESIREIVETFTLNICKNVFGSSRKRRELADSALAELGTTDIVTKNIFSGLFDTIWSLLAGIINTFLKSAAGLAIKYAGNVLTDYLESTVTVWIYALIDSVFS